jgi:pantoate--beta-alanine ligase
VTKLLIQCAPDIALFGQKDYQQLKVITRLAADLGMKVGIVGAPIVRERDGLALSSRNRYLNPDERKKAPMLYTALKECVAKIRAGAPIAAVLDYGKAALAGEGLQVDYFEARNADTLEPLAAIAGEPIRLLVAARIGTTRLIDNVAV